MNIPLNSGFTVRKCMETSVKECRIKANSIHSDEDHEIYEFQRPTTFKESLRRGIPQNTWEIVRKEVNLIDTKRQWFPDGTSIPLKVIDGEVINPLSKPQSRSYHTIHQTYQPRSFTIGCSIYGSC